MIYLRLRSPELPVQARQRIAEELTEAVGRVLKLSPETMTELTLYFEPYRPAQVARGGRLLASSIDMYERVLLDVRGGPRFSPAERAGGIYILEVHCQVLSNNDKRRLAEEATRVLALACEQEKDARVQVTFVDDDWREQVVVGGRILRDLGVAVPVAG